VNQYLLKVNKYSTTGLLIVASTALHNVHHSLATARWPAFRQERNMLNFEYFNPTRVVFGKGSIQRLGSLLPTAARVLLLYGGGSAERNGTLAEVRQALSGHVVHEFGGIEPNPRYETLMRAVALVREQGIDFLLAVGGGSVIDGSKFVAAAALIRATPGTFCPAWDRW
jgi:hypothetical protein